MVNNTTYLTTSKDVFVLRRKMDYPYVDEENGWIWFNEDTIVVDEDVEVKWNGRTKKYYTSCGYSYTKMGDIFMVDIQHLPKTSHMKITVVCPICKIKRVVEYANLTASGHSKDKGCSLIVDKTGDIYGRLTVIEWACKNNQGKSVWKCQCECGEIKNIDGGSLTTGTTKSCGCLNDEMKRERCGEKHIRWNFDLTDEDREHIRDGETKKWAKEIKHIDNYICQCCGYDKGGKLVSHHLNNYNDFPDQRNDLENGITLCEDCHKTFHGKFMGHFQKPCTEQDMIDFCNDYYPDALFLRK